jgi:hypothetical protein
MKKWMLVATAVVTGVTIFSVGFRLTDEVTVIVGLLGLSAAAFGFSAPRQWWLTAIGLGVGVGLHNLYPPPYRQDARHLSRYGPPQPLHLPFGLTGNHAATMIAVTLILMSFLFAATGMGSIVRRNSN